MEENMRTVTDAEFRANLGDMLEYLRSGGRIVITGEGQEDVVLSGSDLSPGYLQAGEELNALRDIARKASQNPLTQAALDYEKRFSRLLPHGRRSLSFEEAMKRTKEKHAEIIKRLEDN